MTNVTETEQEHQEFRLQNDREWRAKLNAAKVREAHLSAALRKITECDTDGLPTYTPQAMQAIACGALATTTTLSRPLGPSGRYAERLRVMATGLFDRALCYAAADELEWAEREREQAVRAEDWENAAHALLWEKGKQELFDQLAAGATREAMSRRGETIRQCQRCQGTGEIVTDWARYQHPNDGDKGDEAVAECPECLGSGAQG